jgi:hypothetical protein
MFCIVCGHSIPDHLESECDKLEGRGTLKGRTYAFVYSVCPECSKRIDSFLAGGDEGAKRREYENKLYDSGLSKEEVDAKMKDFDTQLFGETTFGSVK